jgi:hypothetical protein
LHLKTKTTKNEAMKEKILALLQTKFAGVRTDGLNQLATTMALTVTTEEEATQTVEKLTAEMVGQFITDWRKDIDSEITKANKTHEDNLKKKFNFVEKGAQPKEPEPDPNPPALTSEAIAAIVQKSIEPFVTELASFKTIKTVEARRQLLENELAVLDEGFRTPYLNAFDRMNFKDDDDFNSHLETVKTDVAKLNQSLIDKGLSGTRPIVGFGKPNKEGVSEATQSYIDSQTNEDGKLKGKEI